MWVSEIVCVCVCVWVKESSSREKERETKGGGGRARKRERERERVRKQVPDDMRVVADLEDQYQYPTCLSYADLQPDLVIYSDVMKTAILVELTVCYEYSFEEAKSRRETKYANLVDKIDSSQ